MTRRSAVLAGLLLAACSAAPDARPAAGDTASAPAAEAAAPPPSTPKTGPIRTADDVTGHAWQEVERDPARGEWINPAPGLAVAFPADDPPGGEAADDPASPARALAIYPNRRVAAGGRALAEPGELGIRAVRVENGAAVLDLFESYRRSAKPDDRLGAREVRVRVSPVAEASGVYRWEFSYASPDPCADGEPCVLARPLWVGGVGTRYFERADPADGHPLDQTEPADAPVADGG